MKHTLIDSLKWYRDIQVKKTIQSLKQNNISAHYAVTAEDACKKAISLIPKGVTVAYGGSLTLDEIGMKDALRNGNYNLLDRHRPGIDEEQQYRLRLEGLRADIFLMSTNALTTTGQLVNMDGTGNRVAALIFGPKKVIVIAGINKMVSDVESAIHRIRNYVAPVHAKRTGRDLPCAQTGYCVNCHAPIRFCNALVITEHQYQKNKDRITVIIVGQELGI